jgi:hypothetical protein
MKTRVSLLLVLVTVLAIAPAAMAECKACRPLKETCLTALNGGWLNCVWDESLNNCVTSNWCGTQAASLQVAPLASEFEVAAVERLDEPQTSDTNTTRVASLETAPSLTR